jgi:glycine/serine hydroxymethyltransferase
MKEGDMEILGKFMLRAIEKRTDEAGLAAIHEEVKAFCLQFPVPSLPS